jgi:hypothetical protein
MSPSASEAISADFSTLVKNVALKNLWPVLAVEILLDHPCRNSES